MTDTADATAVRAFLAMVSRRQTAIAAVHGAAAGCAVAAIVVALRWSSPRWLFDSAVISAAVVAGAAIAAVLVNVKNRQRSALLVERVRNCNNLIIAADELFANPDRASSGMSSLVQRQAARIVRGLNVDALFPTRSALLLLSVSAVALAASIALRSLHAVSDTGRAAQASLALPAIGRIEVAVTAPRYASRAPQILRDPARVEALAGSIVHLTVQAIAEAVIVETLTGTRTLATADHKTFTGEVSADADGFISVEPVMTVSKRGTRKLIGLSVTPDRAPHVRVTAPGRDRLFPDGNHSLNLVIEADDDLGLSTLKLRYTKVEGSGERYTFSEGELPIQLTRIDAVNWKARAHWDLRALNLVSGDMVVYRAAATDKRPGSIPTESDSYIAEIRMDGGDAAAGFSVDPVQERYALSQQMIILKTERLVAKKSALTAQAFADAANDIAAEQRRVRAEFVFMMGGELADIPDSQDDLTTLHEEAEAAGEADILDGRGANTGRIALVRAVRAMSGAAKLLNTTVVSQALLSERVALVQLERAFSHTRIILRALTQAERLDLSRRMTGPLLDTGRDQHPNMVADSSPRVNALRSALAGVSELVSNGGAQGNASARASQLAERVLRVSPSERPLQSIAADLNEAASYFGRSQMKNAKHSLEVAAVALTGVLRKEILPAPQQQRTLNDDRISGAIVDALRGVRGSK